MYITALIIGFLGSLHCVGMCGPIALALPVPHGKRTLGFVLYHSGRIMIYASLGLLSSLVGFSASVGGVQQALAISIGVFFLVMLFLPKISHRFLAKYQQSGWMNWVKRTTARQFQHKTYRSTFVAGALNGFLPCGLIYMAIGGSLLNTTLLGGVAYMAMFGLGTLPALIVFWLLPTFTSAKVRSTLQRAVPVFGLFLAALFIYRGISFSMPAIDPFLGAIGFDKIPVCR